MVDALDPEATEIRVLNSLCRLRGRDVLEIGAGNGRLTWRYAERAASVLALEPDEGRVASGGPSPPDPTRCAIAWISVTGTGSRSLHWPGPAPARARRQEALAANRARAAVRSQDQWP